MISGLVTNQHVIILKLTLLLKDTIILVNAGQYFKLVNRWRRIGLGLRKSNLLKTWITGYNGLNI